MDQRQTHEAGRLDRQHAMPWVYHSGRAATRTQAPGRSAPHPSPMDESGYNLSAR